MAIRIADVGCPLENFNFNEALEYWLAAKKRKQFKLRRKLFK